MDLKIRASTVIMNLKSEKKGEIARAPKERDK